MMLEAEKQRLNEEAEKVKDYLQAVHQLKHTEQADDVVAAELIRKHSLVREHVPTWMHNSKEVSNFNNVRLRYKTS